MLFPVLKKFKLKSFQLGFPKNFTKIAATMQNSPVQSTLAYYDVNLTTPSYQSSDDKIQSTAYEDVNSVPTSIHPIQDDTSTSASEIPTSLDVSDLANTTLQTPILDNKTLSSTTYLSYSLTASSFTAIPEARSEASGKPDTKANVLSRLSTSQITEKERKMWRSLYRTYILIKSLAAVNQTTQSMLSFNSMNPYAFFVKPKKVMEIMTQ
ncbi:unnamed protein product [Allacma fusca]|uniref:Uncharacterized protein n=1 Tax=Allacma fusca TaxID=39272 RepID=A0A8J2KHB1_9HEXA|nr:unnamed protein product [Allacma fusca]